MNFITKDDIWGIRKSVREIWNSKVGYKFGDKYHFDAFFNQKIPPAWRETKETVIRHAEEIKGLIQAKNFYRDEIWIKRNGQIKCAKLTDNLLREIKTVELPTYIEIEEEKQKWQSHEDYKKEAGFSTPIREELISLRIHKGGEKNDSKKR